MARLALTIGGAIAGAAIAYFSMGTATAAGIQLGMSIGALAGSIAGQLAFPGQGPKVFGPRVSDLQISSSAPGQCIPILWGTNRLGGQIIWSTGLTETTNTVHQGGKGSPSSSQTTYTYTVSFAAGFCQGPAHVTRMWGDSKLIYNRGGVNKNNKGTWNSVTLYAVNDLVQWENSANVTLYYICMVENVGALPSNGSYWAEDVVDSAANVTKYTSPTIYPGDELQNPDPTIIANEGADVTPSYRGVCYALWENFPLADFGNRLPNIRAEVTSSATGAYPLSVVEFPSNTSPQAAAYYVIPSLDGTTVWVYNGSDGGGGIDVRAGTIMRVDLTTNQNVADGIIDCSSLTCSTEDPSVNGGFGTMVFVPGTDQVPGANGVMTPDTDGNLWGIGTLSGKAALIKVDPWTFKGVQAIDMHEWTDNTGSDRGVIRIGVSLTTTIMPDGSFALVGMGKGFSGNYTLFVYGTQVGPTGVSTAVTGSLVFGLLGQYYAFSPSSQYISQIYPVCDGQGNAFILAEDDLGITGTWHIYKINWVTGAVLPKGAPPLPRGPILMNVQNHSFFPVSTRGTPRAMFYDGADSSLILMTNLGVYLKVDANTFDILDEVGTSFNPQFGCQVVTPWQSSLINNMTLTYDGIELGGPGNGTQMAFRGQIQNGILAAPSLNSDNSGRNILAVNATTFESVSDINLANFSVSGSPSGSSWPQRLMGTLFFDTKSNALVCTSVSNNPHYPATATYPTALYRAYLERLATSGLTADVIVSDICAKANMPPDTYDASALAGIAVQGYTVASLQTPKNMIQTLGQAYFFEGRESDFKIEFVPRAGQSVLVTVPEVDLGLGNDNASLTEQLGQEQDVPKDVEILYTNPQTDYQQGQQKRIRHSRTKKTINQTSISLPLVMNAVEAAQLADKILWTAEQERRTYQTNFWKSYYMLLDPCDVITFSYHGNLLTARITENTIGQNFATNTKMTNEDINSYISIALGSNGTYAGQVVSGLALTKLWMFDMPLISDIDADGAGNTGYYFAMAANSINASWPAGVLYNSSDTLSFTQVDSLTKQVTYASVQNALGAPLYGYFTWDFQNTLTIRMANGSAPTSDTMLNVLNGSNVAVMYPSLEIIQFTTVVDNGDGTFTLSGLLRGRRGSDGYAGAHAIGELLFFPSAGGMKHEQVPLGFLNLLRYYKSITVGADLNSNPVNLPFADTGMDLKPYAPSAVVGSVDMSNNWSVSWMRRCRTGGAWNDGIGQVPLAEDGQAYSVDVLDVDNVTVKRSFTVTTNSISYTAAEQVADFGSNQSTIRVNVYQLSAQVGRGFGANAVIVAGYSNYPAAPVDPAQAMTAAELQIIGSGFTVNGQ